MFAWLGLVAFALAATAAPTTHIFAVEHAADRGVIANLHASVEALVNRLPSKRQLRLPVSEEHGYYAIAESSSTSFILEPTLYRFASHPTMHDTLDDDGALTGEAHQLAHDYVVVTSPPDAFEVMLHHSAFGKLAVVAHAEHRAAAAQQATPSPRVTTAEEAIEVQEFQAMDYETQPTLVVLASGYTNDQRETFWTDVRRVIRALSETGEFAALDASPWPRYYSLVNIVGIFAPSAQEGASTEVGRGYQCSSSSSLETNTVLNNDGGEPASCVAEARDTNLGCAYGTPRPRLLSCDYAKVLTLASHGPTPDTILVIVNDQRYGGTGSDGVAVISNGPDLPFLVVHELNHAVSGLGDEYSYGFAETNPQGYSLPNCAADKRSLPWAGWVAAGAVDGDPQPGCSFDNLYRPTSDDCLMRRKVDHMCPVCRERTTFAIATKRFTNTDDGIGLATPRCPPLGFELLLAHDGSATLSINHRFLTFNSNVSVVWIVPQNSGSPTRIVGLPSIFVRATDLPLGLSEVTATVTDTTSYVLPESRTSGVFTDTASFKIRRLAEGVDAGNCTQLNATELPCRSTTGSMNQYCGICRRAGGCEANYVAVPVQYEWPTIDFDQAQKFIQLLSILLVIVGIVVVGFSAGVIITRRSTKPAELLILPPTEQVVEIVSLVLTGLAFFATCAVIAVLFVQFPRVPMFALDVFIVLFCFASLVYLICGVAFCMVVAHKVIGMLVCGVLNTLLAIAGFGVAAFCFYVAVNSEKDTMVEHYRELWLDNARDHPARVCQVQKFLVCSGFESACVPVPSSYCPRECDIDNRNADPCLPEWQTFVKDALTPVAITLLVYTFLLLVAAAFAVIFAVSVDRIRKVAHGRRSYRRDPRAPVCPITDDELRAVEREFKKADKDHTGTLEGRELIKFMKAVFGQEYSAADEQALLQAATNDDGTERGLTLDEILEIFFPARTLRPDPRLLTDDEALEATNTADLVRRQFRKMEVFMEASGALSPEAMLNLHEAYVRAQEDDGTEFLEVVRKAAKDHSRTVEAAMCRGLTYNDLEGLRCAWVKLHEDIVGTLTDEELAQLFQLTHDQKQFVSAEHFVRWKRSLDVRGRGAVGWPEFCYPFAQRNLLRAAMVKLADAGQEPEIHRGQAATVSREVVALEYGHAYVDEVFLPYEQECPIERLLAVTLAKHRVERTTTKRPYRR
jgi:hypothetical protein